MTKPGLIVAFSCTLALLLTVNRIWFHDTPFNIIVLTCLGTLMGDFFDRGSK